MFDSTPPVSQRDCGPRCASVLLGFLFLGALSAWVASELARPEFMFLGVAGVGAGLVISTTPRYLLAISIATFLITLFISTSADTNGLNRIPAAFGVAFGMAAATAVPWLMTGMGKISALRYPSPLHFAVLMLLAIPAASVIAAFSLQPFLEMTSFDNAKTTILNTALMQAIGMVVVLPVTLVLFGERPTSRFDRGRMVELMLASSLIIGIEIIWLIHHIEAMAYYDWLYPLQASLILIPLTWLATRIGLFGASVGILVLGISMLSVHIVADSWTLSESHSLFTHHLTDKVILLSSALIALSLGVTSDNLTYTRVRAQRNLNEVQSLVDASATGIIRASCNGEIFYSNAYCARMLNTDDAIIGTQLQEYVLPNHRRRLETMLRAVRMTNVVEFELPIIAGATGELWRLAVATYQPATEGRREYLTISIIDLSSARRREESRLRSESERLQQEAQEQISNLTSALLSDANNLAMAVSGTATQARNTRSLDPLMFDEVLGRIESVCIETSSMFERYRRASGSEMPDPNSNCDVTNVLQELLESRKNDPKLALVLDHPSSPISVACDVNFMRFAIDQVVLNSLESSAGLTNLEISIKQNQCDGNVAIHIQDDGPGIDPDDLPQVTKPFFTRKARGRGLGLATIASGMQRLNGSVNIESTLGNGTTVTLTFPKLSPNPLETECLDTRWFESAVSQPAGTRSTESVESESTSPFPSNVVDGSPPYA